MSIRAFRVKPENIHKTLRAMRQESGLTMAEVAKLAGKKSTGSISHYETGKRKSSSFDFLELIAAVFGYDIEIRFVRKDNEMDDYKEYQEIHVDYCEICGDKADTTCQNCQQLVCGGCCELVDWGEGEIVVCDNCMGVIDDYRHMDEDHFS